MEQSRADAVFVFMTWRVAESLETLRKQLNEAFPNRSKKSDGGIGDAKHASRSSDHNPWVQYKGQGIVTARDFTHDPAGGLDCNWLAQKLVKNKDSRIKYIIWNKRICSSKTSPWQWRPYNGVNAHQHHLHLSVDADPKRFDSVTPWDLDLEDDVARSYDDAFEELRDDVHLDSLTDSAVPAPVPPVDTVKRDEQTDPPSTPPKDQPDEQPPPVTQLANTIVNNGDSTPPAKNVVIEKGEGWFKRKWREIVAFVTGNSMLDGWSERLAQVQALGLPPRFWTNLIYFTVGGAVIYFAFDWYRDYQGRKLTNKLIDANSTATNLVRVAPSSKIDDMYAADPNWEVIKKN